MIPCFIGIQDGHADYAARPITVSPLKIQRLELITSTGITSLLNDDPLAGVRTQCSMQGNNQVLNRSPPSDSQPQHLEFLMNRCPAGSRHPPLGMVCSSSGTCARSCDRYHPQPTQLSQELRVSGGASGVSLRGSLRAS